MCYLLLHHVTDGFGLKIAPYEVLTEKCTLLIGWLVVTYACNVAVLPAKFSSREYQIAVVWMNLAGVLCLVIDSPSMFCITCSTQKISFFELEDLYYGREHVRLASDICVCFHQTEELLSAGTSKRRTTLKHYKAPN